MTFARSGLWRIFRIALQDSRFAFHSARIVTYAQVQRWRQSHMGVFLPIVLGRINYCVRWTQFNTRYGHRISAISVVMLLGDHCWNFWDTLQNRPFSQLWRARDLDLDIRWPWKSYCENDLYQYHILACGYNEFDCGRTHGRMDGWTNGRFFNNSMSHLCWWAKLTNHI